MAATLTTLVLGFLQPVVSHAESLYEQAMRYVDNQGRIKGNIFLRRVSVGDDHAILRIDYRLENGIEVRTGYRPMAGGPDSSGDINIIFQRRPNLYLFTRGDQSEKYTDPLEDGLNRNEVLDVPQTEPKQEVKNKIDI